MIKTVIFDLDGTLYNLEGGKFKGSNLQKSILERAVLFLEEKLLFDGNKARDALKIILDKYGEDISLGMESEYGISRKEYFDYVWNIDPEKIVFKSKELVSLINRMSVIYDLILVSDAPKIWIKNVINYLEISDFFKGVENGEDDFRKSNGNIFPKIIKKYSLEPNNTVFVGDQEEEDVVIPTKYGFKTIKVGSSDAANSSIKNIYEIDDAVRSICMKKNYKRKLQIGVMGSAADLKYSSEISNLAEEVGELIAKSDNITVYGAEKDYDSLSTAAAKGAKRFDGLTVGVTYGKGKDIFDKENTDVCVVTGLERGGGREFVLVNSCDVIIAISGGSGTLTELAIAYQSDIPMIVINGTGGWSDKLSDTYFDARERRKVIGVDTPEQAVSLAIKLAKERLLSLDKLNRLEGEIK